nr:hypothetical protein [Tanacetum cinerariifolium]
MANSWKDKDWSALTDEIMEYVIAKYGKNWKENDEMVDIILEDLRKKGYNEPEVAKVLKNNHKPLQLQLQDENLHDSIAPNAADVGSSSTKRKSNNSACSLKNDLISANYEVLEMKSSQVGKEVEGVCFNVCLLEPLFVRSDG